MLYAGAVVAEPKLIEPLTTQAILVELSHCAGALTLITIGLLFSVVNSR